MQPLKGLTVVTLEHAIAAPFATRQLADLGARVIKIERPGTGDFARGYDARVRGLASHFVWTNRSKESLTLDVKHPEAAKVLERLVLEKADVVVQNLAPGAAARLGLGYDALAAKKPAIIVCDVSGYGADGPYRDKKAYDLLIQSEAGFVSVTGTPDEPCKAGPSIADIAAGMYAYTSILAALLQRSQTGRGQHIDISMLESLAEWTSYPLYYAFDGAPPPPRTGAAHATIYPYGPFPTGADNGSVMLGLQNEREWVNFCEKVLLRPELARDPRFAGNARRVAERAALRQLIVETFAPLTAPQVVERLEAAQIANARVNTMREVWEHPQLKARERWREVGSPAGMLPAMLPPGTWKEGPRMDPVPALGEHTDAILRELGIDADAIVLDLEDAVALSSKVEARNAIAQWSREATEADRARIIVRINDALSAHFANDLQLLRDARIPGVMLPKAESAAQVQAVRDAVPDAHVLALIESACGVANAHDVAGAAGVARLVFGTLDYALDLDLDIADNSEGLVHAASVLAIASRVAGLSAPVAGVTPQIDDEPRLLADLAWSRRQGFGAKLCIHPRQVAPIHAAFAPSAQAIAWARRVLAAEAASPGAAQLDGRMIDRPVVLQAQRTLLRAGA